MTGAEAFLGRGFQGLASGGAVRGPSGASKGRGIQELLIQAVVGHK